MPDRDILATRNRLGLTTAGLARLVGVGRRTAHRWINDKMPVPEPVWRLLELIETAHTLGLASPGDGEMFDRMVERFKLMVERAA